MLCVGSHGKRGETDSGRRSLQTEGTSGLWTVWEKLSDKAFYGKGMSILKALSGREKIDGDTAKRTIRDPVGWGIPEVLKGRGSSPV